MQIMFPTGRIVGGSVDTLKPRLDDDGKPKFEKDGVTPMKQCNFGFAIKKGAETHWNQTAWGAQMFEIGKAAYPREHLALTFAWKVTDGDSNIPNRRGKAPSSNEHYRGHWVIWFSQGWLPTLCNVDGSVKLGVGSIKPGYFVKVMAEVTGNAPSKSPGIYVNPQAVALVAEGDEIAAEVDTTMFGAAPAEPLPAGARPVTHAVPGFAPAAPAAPTAPATAPVAPDPRFLAVPPPVAPPVSPPPKPARQMTAAANGATYEQYVAAGWSDAQMIQAGLLTA